VRANLVLADVANERIDDAIRDGNAMVKDIAQPTEFGMIFLGLAHALAGDSATARATFDALTKTEPEAGDVSNADLALFESRAADAEALLQPYIDKAIAAHKPTTVTTEQLMLAVARLQRGDRKGAAHAATLAMGDGSPIGEYLAAKVAIEAGAPAGADAKARAWSDRESADWRFGGALLVADLALAAGKPKDAIAAYEHAGRIAHNSWMQRAGLGRAYAAAHAWADAERELSWCHDHRGEAAVTATPSLWLIPPVEAALAQTRAAKR
jgi:hypothetical protein